MKGPSCVTCKHFDVTRYDKDVCSAFPDGIPFEIRLGKVSHKTPVDGDHGIVYEPAHGFEKKSEDAA